jgi:hypothetical protein
MPVLGSRIPVGFPGPRSFAVQPSRGHPDASNGETLAECQGARKIHEDRAPPSRRSIRLNTYLLGHLKILTQYGPVLLKPAEYLGVLQQRLEAY